MGKGRARVRKENGRGQRGGEEMRLCPPLPKPWLRHCNGIPHSNVKPIMLHSAFTFAILSTCCPENIHN